MKLMSKKDLDEFKAGLPFVAVVTVLWVLFLALAVVAAKWL